MVRDHRTFRAPYMEASVPGDEVIGAAMGYYWAEEHTYLTHLTAVGRNLQGGGIGLFLRRQQLHQLAQRIGPGPGPLEVVSLSASSNGAVQFFSAGC